MNPILVLITDTHLKEENRDTVTHVFSEAMINALSRDLTTVYCLGDIFESRKGQLASLLSTFEDILDMYQDNNVKLITCVGNHDKTDYSDSYSFLSPFKHHPALHLVPIFETFDINENTTFSLLSFFDDVLYLQYITKLKEQLSLNSPGKRHLLGTHIGISGVRMHSGEEFKSEKINGKIFDLFEQVYVGHFHDPGTYFNNVHYIGSAFQHDFGEDMDKGLTLISENNTISLDKLQLSNSQSKNSDISLDIIQENVISQNNDIFVERIQLNTPSFRKLTFNVSTLDESTYLYIEKLKQDNPEDMIRVVLTGQDANIKAFNKSDLLSLGIDVKVKSDKIERVEIENNVHMFDNNNIKDQFKVFCEKSSLDLKKGESYLTQIIK